jgi:lysophospholipase L1-like esterase
MKQKVFLVLSSIVLSISFLLPAPVQEPEFQEPEFQEPEVQEPAGKIFCFGDSITHARGHGWVEMIGEKQSSAVMVNAGRSGRKTSDMDELAGPLSENLDADWVLFFLGVNDLKNGTPEMLNACVENMDWMIGQVRGKIPGARIVLMAPTDINLVSMNKTNRDKNYNGKTKDSLYLMEKEYVKLAARNGIDFISLLHAVSRGNFTDGLHPDQKGQQQIGDAVWQGLIRLSREKAAVSANTSALEQPGGYAVDSLVFPLIPDQIITVGAEGSDICGFTNRAVQNAIDLLPARGGTVRMTPGVFRVTAPVRVKSNVRLEGSGPETVFRIGDGVSSRFIVDADFGELKVTVEDPAGFEPGMALQVTDENQNSCWAVSTARITAIQDNVLYFDTGLVRDYRADQGGIVSNATSAVEAVEAENVVMTNFSVDGNRAKSSRMDGCRGAGVFIFRSKNVLVSNVQVKECNGEGISWQITEDVTVRGCEISRSANMGMHPGTGSPRTVIENTNSHHNDVDGLFICWRVHHSLIKGNLFHDNGRFGICNGHKDSDILFTENKIYANGSDGVNFRGERAPNAPHRSTFLKNIIENNGIKEAGYGLSFNSPAEDVLLKENIIRDTGKGTQKAGIMIYENGLPVKMENNKISGHPEGDVLSEKDQKQGMIF